MSFIAFDNTTDPKRAAANQRAMIQQRGDQLGGAADREMEAEQARRKQSAGYLDELYSPMAEGQGGYSADEASQIMGDTGSYTRYFDPNAMSADVAQGNQDILMSPEERQAIITGAGITVGNRDRAAVDSLERSARAAGSGPMGVAAYRARMERQAAGDAGDAMTQARVQAGASSASRANTALQNTMNQNQYNASTGTGIAQAQDTANSGRAKTVADMRLGKQTEGLQYYQGQNQQANDNANLAANRAAGIYGTQAGATNDAAKLTQAASQNPGWLEKAAGIATGAVGALGGGTGLKAVGLADGGVVTSPTVATVGEAGPESVSRVGAPTGNPGYSPAASGGGMGSAPQQAHGVAAYKAPGQTAPQPFSTGAQSGGFMPPAAQAPQSQMVTKPTTAILGENLKPGQADVVTPMGYRPQAKVRPGMMQQPQRRYYGQAA